MGVQTHVVKYSGLQVGAIDAYAEREDFLLPLRQFGKNSNWYLVLYALPAGKRYEELTHEPSLYLQAAGHSASAITVEIRKLGGEQWGVDEVRYVIGRKPPGDAPLDVKLELPHGPIWVSRDEVFDAEQAADLFLSYYKTGDIPAGFDLRPVEGYTASGDLVDLRGVTA